jgi:hypothetical protein
MSELMSLTGPHAKCQRVSAPSATEVLQTNYARTENSHFDPDPTWD